MIASEITQKPLDNHLDQKYFIASLPPVRVGGSRLGIGMTETDLEVQIEGRSILVVEDENFTRHILCNFLLRGQGCRLHQATNGLEAVAKLDELDGGVDCIVTDIKMAPMNGLQLLQAIRSGRTKVDFKVPVLLLTGHSDVSCLRTAMALDVSGFIVKPASRQALMVRLACALEGTARRQTEGDDAANKDPREYFLVDVPDRIGEPPPLRRNRIDEHQDIIGIRMDLEEVHPNAVLTRDVYMANGTLLLPAGAPLSARNRARLADLASMDPELRMVWVRPPEAA